jgi:hypothetical protein
MEEIIEHMSCLDKINARQWLTTMLATLKQDDIVRVGVKLWASCLARRKAIREQVFQSMLFIHYFVDNFVRIWFFCSRAHMLLLQ